MLTTLHFFRLADVESRKKKNLQTEVSVSSWAVIAAEFYKSVSGTLRTTKRGPFSSIIFEKRQHFHNLKLQHWAAHTI